MKKSIVLIALLAACSGGKATPEKSGGKGGGKGGAVAYAVDVTPVTVERVEYIVNAPGTLEAFERVLVTARVAGVVDKVAFTEGQEVKKGDILVIIESERFQLAVNSASVAVNKAKAALADAEAQVARREAATKEHPGLITGEELAIYKTKALTAKADADAAAESLKIAQLNLRDAHVRAPISGVMQTRTIETGQYVQPGYLMATLLRRDPMLVRFPVDPKDAPRLKPGMLASFTLRETSNRTYPAKLNLIAGSADPTTHTVGVLAEVIDEGHQFWLRPGSFCDVTINVGASREAPLIPRTAARATDHGYVVYVIENDVAVEKSITLGMNTKDGRVEVRTGLKGGDLLVIRGAEALTNGAKVKTTKVGYTPTPEPSASAEPPEPLPSASASAVSAPGDGKKKWKKP